jgi:hypothetical protein
MSQLRWRIMHILGIRCGALSHLTLSKAIMSLAPLVGPSCSSTCSRGVYITLGRLDQMAAAAVQGAMAFLDTGYDSAVWESQGRIVPECLTGPWLASASPTNAGSLYSSAAFFGKSPNVRFANSHKSLFGGTIEMKQTFTNQGNAR